MAELSVQDIKIGGLEPSLTSANSGGDSMPNDERTFLYVENTDTADHDVQLDADQSAGPDGKDYQDPDAVTIPAGSFKLIGGKDFKRKFFGETINWTYSDVTGMQVAAIRLTGVQPRG